MDMGERILHLPFDSKLHKEYFVNYLEVIIRENGVVEYAVPSHTEKLVAILAEQRGVTRSEIVNSCPPEWRWSWMEWLIKESHCLSVWTNCFMGTPNRKQKAVLKKLKMDGLYRGLL